MDVMGLMIFSDTQNGFAFLEALTSDIAVESLGRSFDGLSAHTGLRVRPSTSGNLPSTLQLLPGQSFYIGKTTLSLVPGEHSDLPVKSSGLPDSISEIYNQQVSQIGTPQRTVGVDYVVMETPMPYRDQILTPILEQITGRAISGREGSEKWPQSPSKHQIMRTVRDASEHGHPSLQPEVKKEDEHIVVAAINEPDRPSSQPKVKTEDDDIAHSIAARPMEQSVMDLEDTEMAGVDLGREPEPSGRSPILPAVSDSLPQLEDDINGPVRKKAKTAAVSHKASMEGDEVTTVKIGLPAPTDRPVSTGEVSSTFTTPSINTDSRSRSVNQPRQRSPTTSTGPKHLSPSIDSVSRPHPANEPPSDPSINSIGPKPRTPLSDWNTFSASPSKSVEPNSSMRSTRSSARDEHNGSSSMHAGTRILFASSSSAGDSKPFLKFLSNKGVKKVQSVHDCTVLCVGKELKKTSKLILAVLLGKDIITDSWVTESVKGNDLLSVVPYMARDAEKEAEWGISLDEAIFRGKQGLKILQEQTIIFTPSSKKELGKSGFDELKEIVKYAGAKSVSSALPKKSPEGTPSTIVIATHDNTEIAELQKLGWRAYVKDIISLSVLRGNLDLESDEFLIQEQKKESRKRKR